MTMTNISFLVSNIDPLIGGTERVTQSIAENLVSKGYNTFLYIPMLIIMVYLLIEK